MQPRSIALAILFLLATALSAQVATLTGRVADSSGAVVPKAAVAARSQTTGVTTSTESTGEGYYTLPALPPGRYDVTASRTGFRTVRQSGLELTVQQTARLDIVLEVGTLVETVEVKAEAPLLDSETSTLGQVIGNRQVTELPLLGRNT
jgi:hypothetical protein